MPTLRARPSRGDSLPDQGKSPPSKEDQNPTMEPGDAIEVQESIEAKPSVDEDVEMEDAGGPDKGDAAAPGAGADGDADGEADADGEPDDTGTGAAPTPTPSREPKNLHQQIETTAHYLSNYEEDGQEIAAGFQRIPNKRQLPDYFDVIKEPIAFSTIRGKLLKKSYTEFSQFVRDVAQICHNAQVYNRPSAPIFEAAVRLREIFKKKLQEYVGTGEITAEEAELPDLGELPPVDDSPLAEQGEYDEDEEDEAEDEDDEDDEEEEDEDDDSDEDGVRRRGRRRGRPSMGGRRDRGDDGDDAHKRHGRPPKVFTPLEARTLALLKGLRKFKNDDGELRITAFEKLPDKAVVPDYYTTIQNPIAIDTIRRKHKRKKYQNVDEVLADLEVMFDNAKEYNEEGSELYEDAVELQKQARLLAEQEKAKPDDEFRDEEGRLPLLGIQYKGEIWRVGDWVHIANPNDPRKPIVAQIYRTYQDKAGLKWINACWYYRPEQTVHRFEKHFYENEVFKTGQYRDHRIEEIDDRCFVMFITRYPKGRPRGYPPGKAVYVCESRYNDEKFTFNKIKTWASCLPDEVREKDYEMDLFAVPHRLRKAPSPIKHLLREDAKETDALPKPTWASPNAPPMIGAVHRRPREVNESPPPEPMPTPTSAPPPQLHMDPTRRPSVKSDVSMTGTPYVPAAPLVAPSPSAMHYVQQFAAPARQAATPVPQIPQPMHHLQGVPPQVPHPKAQMAQAPQYHSYNTPTYVPQQMQPATHYQVSQHITTPYDHHRAANPAAMTPSRQQQQPMAPSPSVSAMPGPQAHHANTHAHANQYNMPARSYEVFRILDPNVEAGIPAEVRQQFHRDDEGRLLFFSAASREPERVARVADQYAGLGHSVSHLASIRQVREERRRKRKERDEAMAGEARQAEKRAKAEGEDQGAGGDRAGGEQGRLLAEGLIAWAEEMDRGTAAINEDLRGWKEVKRADAEEKKKARAGRTTTTT